ncbi:MAG: tetratricopeptide repeat protein [Elusimicrobia bacterium]|nr:tetratricopeptide repeat protein [Elusimicrobiota bacterium]
MIRILALSVSLAAGSASAQAPSQAPAASSTADLAAHSSAAEPQAPTPKQALSRRWSFLEAAAKNDDYAGAESAMVDDLNLLISQSGASSDAAQARFLAASLEEREGLHEQAMVDLLHLLYEFPTADVSMQAQSMFQDIAKKRLPGRYKGAVANISQAASGSSSADRLAALSHLLVQDFGAELYGPIRGEIRGFMARFPDYSGMDRVQWDLVSLDEAKGNSQAALLEAREFLALYPRSALAEKAQFKLGALYARLGLYQKAVGAYQAFTAAYPQSPDAVSALSQIAAIFAEHLDQYEMAVKTDEMIVAQVSQGRPAAEALYQEAGLYDCRFLFFSCKLDDPSKALSVYQRIVNTGNLDFLDRKEAERVRSRINDLSKSGAKSQAPSQTVQPAAAGAGGQ